MKLRYNSLIKVIKRFFTGGLTLFLLLCCFGNAEGNVTLKHNGLCTATFTFLTNSTQEEFSKEVNDMVAGYNQIAGLPKPTIEVSSIEQTSTGFKVKIKTRRIDKLKPSGNFALSGFSEFVEEGTQTKEQLLKYEKGNISSVSISTLNGKISFDRESYHVVSPFRSNGESLSVQQLEDESKKLSKNSEIVVFRMFGLQGLTKIEINLPGEILYYGGSCVEVLDNSSAALNVENIQGIVTTNEWVKDENGDEFLEVRSERKEIDGFIGYIVYDQSISPFSIGIIVAAVCLVIIAAVGLYIKFYRDGLKIISAKKGKGNL